MVLIPGKSVEGATFWYERSSITNTSWSRQPPEEPAKLLLVEDLSRGVVRIVDCNGGRAIPMRILGQLLPDSLDDRISVKREFRRERDSTHGRESNARMSS